jgi:ketosteroid isomerase-like protein
MSLIERAKTFYQLALSDLPRAIEECIAPEFVLENPLPGVIPFGGRYEGGDGLALYLQRIAEHIDMGPLDLQEWVEAGPNVIVCGFEKSVVRTTGRTYEMEFVHWLRFAPDGRLLHMREYNDTAAMAAAFGS